MPLKKKTAEPEKYAVTPSRDGTVNMDGAGRSVAQEQLTVFDEAIRVFRSQNFKEARELFLAAAEGPQKDIAYNARLHVSMCDRRTTKPSVDLHTADEHYNYAIERINARDIEIARRHLDLALDLDRTADHVLYALALCCGLDGDVAGAYENLKYAIELQPGNRVTARQDADFAAFATTPQLQRLLYPERHS